MAFLGGMLVVVAVGGAVVAVGAIPSSEQRNRHRWAEKRLQAIKPFLRENAVAAEIGVFRGDFTRLLVHNLKPSKLHLVDPWYLQGKDWEWEHENKSTIRALTAIMNEYESELVSGQIVLNVAFDQDLLPTLPDAYFDWIYLDTTHEYAQTKQELQLLQQKVKPSGVIAGDDWQPDPRHRHHGVYKAVQELIAQGQYEILYANAENWQWAIARKDRGQGRPSHP